MKKIWRSLIFALVLFAAFGMLSGCSTPNDTDDTKVTPDSQGSSAQVITDSTGQYQITIPQDWQQPKVMQGEDSNIEVHSKDGNQMVVVVCEEKVDYNMDLKGYNELILGMVEEDFQVMGDYEIVADTVNGCQAYYSKIDVAEGVLNMVVWSYVVETKNCYNRISGLTMKSMEAENEGTIKQVIKSFKELEPAS